MTAFTGRIIGSTVGLIVLCVAASAGDATDDWRSFRNGGNSISSAPLLTHWTPDSGIAWQKELDGYGQSSPVICNGTAYVTTVVGPNKELCTVTAYSLHSGEIQWQHRFAAATTGPSSYMYSRAAPTPCADDNGVYCFFESGDLVALSPTGSIRWRCNLNSVCGPIEARHGLGSSLAQSESALFLNVEHRGPSMLLAFDKATGETRWSAERPSGSSWTSPVVTTTSPQQVVVSSAGAVTGYAADSGEKQWQIDGLSGNTVPSPTVIGDRLFTGARVPEFGNAADASQSHLCLQLPTQEDASPQVQWRAAQAVCDYASPVVCGKHTYYLNKVGVLCCVDSETGETVYRKRLGVECWATPVVAHDLIYFFGKNGQTAVVRNDRQFKQAALNSLWDPESPPAPEFYVEFSSEDRSEHGAAGDSTDQGSGGDASSESRSGGRASRMVTMLLRNDQNSDGLLDRSEAPEDFVDSFDRLDTNADGQLDRAELDEMARQFAERRASSRASARDPIVYAAAAADGVILIRTGTRLYALAAASQPSEETP